MRIFCTSRISWKRISDWLPIVFHFGTENLEEQFKKTPCIRRTPGWLPASPTHYCWQSLYLAVRICRRYCCYCILHFAVCRYVLFGTLLNIYIHHQAGFICGAKHISEGKARSNVLVCQKIAGGTLPSTRRKDGLEQNLFLQISQ